MGEALNVRVGDSKASGLAEAVAAKTRLEDDSLIHVPDSSDRGKIEAILKRASLPQANAVHQAILLVRKDLLVDLLALPPGTEIVGVTYDAADPWNLRLVVQHPDLKPVPPGMPLPVCSPQYQQRTVERHVSFVGWGQTL